MHRVLSVLALALLLAACGDDESTTDASSEGDVASFGADDTICPSLTLFNDADDEQITRAARECFLDAVDADTPVVWDVSRPTVEGDPIYHRFQFTGDDVVIVRDDRADTFGIGTVGAERCAAITTEEAEWLPVGVDCEPIDHPGFRDAEPG